MKERKDLLHIHKSVGRPLILDGAIGSLLQCKTKQRKSPLWSSMLNLTAPDLVCNLHREYISHGAEIITTNTFRTNPVALEKAGVLDNAENIVKKSIEIVFQAFEQEETETLIAGANPPAEDSYQKERTLSPSKIEYNHKKHIELLWENGCDFILNETQSHFDEIKIISKFCRNNRIPYVISLFFTPELRILSGEMLVDVIDSLHEYSPDVISINCIGKNEFSKVKFHSYFREIKGLYLNVGSGNYNDEHIACGINPEEYLKIISSINSKNFIFIGSCCGSGPNHTKLLKDYFSG